jgi:hypothetical protein
MQEDVESLCEFLSTEKLRAEFINTRIPEILDVFYFFADHPEIHGPYLGQPLVNSASGRSDVVSLKAIRSSLKQFVIFNDKQVSDDLIMHLVIESLSPWRAKHLPTIHVVNNSASSSNGLRSFLRFVDSKKLADINYHATISSLANHIHENPLPPYFHAVGSNVPQEVQTAIAQRAGFLYSEFPKEPFSVFRESTTSQAWACGVRPDQVEATKELLLTVYQEECLKTGAAARRVHLHVEKPEIEEEEEQELAMEQEGGKSPH